MKVAVFADTHGTLSYACDAVRESKPDAIIHLGDHDRDAEAIRRMFPDIPMYSVRGNCDMTPIAPDRAVVTLGPVKAFITHGHLYDVDWSTDRLVYAAQENGCSLAMYGHTHSAEQHTQGGVTVLNPGTAGRARTREGLTWALVTVMENGGIACEIRNFAK